MLGLCGGCASPAFKGTPLYSAAEEPAAGAPRERIWLWPLLYYRDPVLSVAWPLFEKNDEWFAIRPLYSVYGLDRPKHVHNLLWPLAQWDWETGRHHVFPYFGGPDYNVVLPLYWHFGGGGREQTTDILFPLWYYGGDDHSFRFSLLGPLFYVKDEPRESACQFWPIAGVYRRASGSYRFQAWPLAHQWREDGGRCGRDMLLPLYYRDWDGEQRRFISPLWMSGENGDDDAWTCLFPLAYHRRQGSYRNTITPLGFAGGEEGREWSSVFPLYYHRRNEEGSRFLSLPWSFGSNHDGTDRWKLAMPLYYGRSTPDSSLFLTPMGGRYDGKVNDAWGFLPALSWGRRTASGESLWVAGGLGRKARDGEARSHHVIPFYFRSRTPERSTFLSLPYSHYEAKAGGRWDLVFPLFYRQSTSERDRWLTLLAGGGRALDGSDDWNAVWPLYYRSRDPDGMTVATALGGYREDLAGRRWTIWPLLTWGSRTGADAEFWALAPLVHYERRAGNVQHHFLPFYYRDHDTILSLFAGQWQGEDGNRVTVVPPALSWQVSTPERKDLWLAGGLARASWGEKPGPHYLFPAYYRDAREDVFVSALVSRWNWEEKGPRYTLIPPLLALGVKSEHRHDLWYLGGLARASWGEKPGPHYLFPAYYRDAEHHAFVSALWARGQAGEGQWGIIPPLLGGWYTEPGSGTRILGAGLYYRTWDSSAGTSRGYLLPLYYYDEPGTFLSLLVGWGRSGGNEFFYPFTPLAGIRKGEETGGWFFPFFSHRRDASSGEVRGGVLWGRYWKERQESGFSLLPFCYHALKRDATGPAEDSDVATYIFPSFLRTRTTVESPAAGAPGERVRARRNAFFPFWWSTREGPSSDPSRETWGYALAGLWSWKREWVAQPDGKRVPQDVRRVLGWLYRYERIGDDVAISMVPGVTYDRCADGYRRTTFLMRFYRNEVLATGERNLDIAFIPIRRATRAE